MRMLRGDRRGRQRLTLCSRHQLRDVTSTVDDLLGPARTHRVRPQQHRSGRPWRVIVISSPR
jgi:hypothetical protein